MKLPKFRPPARLFPKPTVRHDSGELPTQQLRRDAGHFPQQSLRRAEDNDGAIAEDLGLLLSSLECLEDDYGSYAPVTASASQKEQPTASVTLLDVKNGASDSMGVEAELTPSDFLKLGPNKVFEVTQSLGGRLLDSPTFRGRSFSCTSDAATEVWSNLTGSKVAANEDNGITEIEVLLNNREALACTFAGKEETCLGDDESNTLCGIDDSYKDDKEINAETKPKVLVSGADGDDGEVELLYEGPVAAATNLSSQTETTLLDSSISMSASSSSSQGILRPPKRAAVGNAGFDPFGVKSDFRLPGLPLRRVRFSMGKLSGKKKLDEGGKSGLESPMRAQGAECSLMDADSDSTPSLQYLLEFCGSTMAEI